MRSFLSFLSEVATQTTASADTTGAGSLLSGLLYDFLHRFHFGLLCRIVRAAPAKVPDRFDLRGVPSDIGQCDIG
jgi:hypothetical protein